MNLTSNAIPNSLLVLTNVPRNFFCERRCSLNRSFTVRAYCFAIIKMINADKFTRRITCSPLAAVTRNALDTLADISELYIQTLARDLGRFRDLEVSSGERPFHDTIQAVLHHQGVVSVEKLAAWSQLVRDRNRKYREYLPEILDEYRMVRRSVVDSVQKSLANAQRNQNSIQRYVETRFFDEL